ncbi:hypothetical protein GGS26DRAFT_599786 [Hypomontagnella submonticulosa]|nr:hypothetical protein GGS26DRAFT_599786 [Hypomontagnella submonticulosa]
MAVMTRILVVGLLALFYGVVHGTAVQMDNRQEWVQRSSPQVEAAPITTVDIVSESITTATWLFNLSTFSTIYINPSQPLRTTQVGNAMALSTFSSVPPTRTSEITSRPLGPPLVTSYDDNPIMTELPELPTGDFLAIQSLGNADTGISPRDEPDGYGYGSGSDATSVVNGGYGNQPGPTVLPPGAYGNQQPSATDDPTIVTVTDPATEFITLELRSSSLTGGSPADPTIVFVTVTSTPLVHPPMHNVTVIVTASKSTSLSPVVVTVTATASSTQKSTSPSTAGYVYTTATEPSSTSHASFTTYTVVYTPTAHPLPRPVPANGVAGIGLHLNKHLLFAAAGMAILGPWLLSSLGVLSALMASNKGGAQRNAH